MTRMVFALLVLGLSLCFTDASYARGRGRVINTVGSVFRALPPGHSNSTAQGVANALAHLRWMGHFGGHHPYYEGCGMSSTPAGAYNNCCYANSGMRTVDVGYAQDVLGNWYCCRRYAR